MATSQQQLAFAIRAVNEASATLKTVQNDIDGVGKSAERSDGHMGKFGSALGGVAKIAGGFVVAQGLLKLPGLLSGAAQAAAEDEAAAMRLDKALENYLKTLDDGGDIADGMKELTGDMEERIAAAQKLAFSDDEVRNSMQKLLAATGDYGEATKRQAVAMDLARGAGIGLEQASTLLGKVTDENVNVFKRMGITMKEGATEADVLATIQGKFGGQADAYAKSTAGQMEQAKIRMAELHEQIGGFVLPIMTKLGSVLVDEVFPRVESFVNAVGPLVKRYAEWWTENVLPVYQRVADFVVEVILPRIREFAEMARMKFAEFQRYYEESIKPALENIQTGIAAVIGFIHDHWPEIWAIIGPVVAQIESTFRTVFSVITGLLDAVIKLISGDFSGAWRALGGVVDAMWRGIVESARNSINVVIGLMNALISGWNALSFSVSIPFGPTFDVGTPDLPHIPQLASGGIVRARPGGMLALIGEGGQDEAVVPLGRGAGIGNTYNITVNALDAQGAADTVLAVLVDLDRRGRLVGIGWQT